MLLTQANASPAAVSLDVVSRERTDQPAVIKSVTVVERSETVYNFEVAEAHTYYVGTDEVLVHNDCVAIHGYGFGDYIGGQPEDVRRLAQTVVGLYSDDPAEIPIVLPDVEFSEDGNALPEGPTAAQNAPHQNPKTVKLLAGFSMGADTVMLTDRAADGQEWDARVAIAPRADLVGENIERLAESGQLVIIANIQCDRNFDNDLSVPPVPAIGDPSGFEQMAVRESILAIKRAGGDRTPQGRSQAILNSTGMTAEQLQQKYPNVVLVDIAQREHFGAGSSDEAMRAVRNGYSIYY